VTLSGTRTGRSRGSIKCCLPDLRPDNQHSLGCAWARYGVSAVQWYRRALADGRGTHAFRWRSLSDRGPKESNLASGQLSEGNKRGAYIVYRTYGFYLGC